MTLRTRTVAITALILALAAGLVWYFFLRSPAPSPTAGRTGETADGPRQAGGTGARQRRGTRGAALVTVAKVRMETVGNRVAAVGTGRSIRSLTVTAEVSGIISEITFQAGEVVKKGQVLVKLQSEAEEIAVKLAQVKVDEAAANLARYEALSERNAVATVQVQQARTAVALARAELEAKQYELRRRTITAPFDGAMGLTNLVVGDYLQQGAAIASIDDRSSLRVAFVVAERFAGSLKLGQAVRASSPALPGLAVHGTLTALDTRIDAASRTLRAEATLPNAEQRLIPGMTFSVSIDIPGETLPVIPGLAIQWDRNGAYVWAVGKDGKVSRIGVTIRQRDNEQVAVEAKLQEGDEVVTEGLQGLREGAQVTVVRQ